MCHTRRRRLTPPGRVKPRRSQVHGPRAPVCPKLRGAGEPAERPTRNLTAEPGATEPILELKRQDATQRIQSVGRLRPCTELNLVDRKLRDQVELNRIAERFIDPDTALVDRNTLRQPQDRRRRESAEPESRLKQIPGGPFKSDTAKAFIQRVGEGRRPSGRYRGGRPEIRRVPWV